MTQESLIQDHIYRSVKDSLGRGEFSSGEHLDISRIATAFRASQTPVREVMGRLVGEGIVEHREGGGYQLWLPNAEGLRDFYAWNSQHLLAALHTVREPVMIRALEPIRSSPPGATTKEQILLLAQIFQAIGDCTGNQEFSDRVRNANERLMCIRFAEGELFHDIDTEASRFLALGRFDVQKNVRRRILAYHRRRIDRASQILGIARTMRALR